ncbi:hypothetical protein F4604DRAFT_1682807 [Suillus subluteus]|nr:hypothetical protein F4604DRAFT_1682807 [Suillus subluteus]
MQLLMLSGSLVNLMMDLLKSHSGTKELTPAKTYCVYARDITGGPSCLTSLDHDTLGPGAMAKICWLPQGLDVEAILALHSGVLQREGFEEMQWAHVLDANLVCIFKQVLLLHCCPINSPPLHHGTWKDKQSQEMLVQPTWTRFKPFPRNVDGLLKGNHWKLVEFIASHKETLCIDYARLSHAQKDNYEVKIMKMHADKQCMVHDNPRAVQHDMHIIQWTAICSHLGVEGFYVAVCEKAEKFVQTILDLEPQHLALKMEAFVVSGLAEDIPTNVKGEKIPQPADFILCKNKLTNHTKMNYENYKYTIVEHYSMELKGTCKWTKLTKEELADRITSNHTQQAARETVYKPQKKCAKKTVEKSAAIIESSSESDESEGDDGGNK